ncbi:MAG: DUF4037 domain-containing protein [Dehalococcoidia bacterium]|nr:DUF4037 domain-containing protein [Dehalococcoidia bacterium]
MKGLEISERYFWAYGAPMIEQKFGDYKQRIAAGLVGDGSECYGFDDEISRDHDWGPCFCLWLNKQDYQEIGMKLQEEMAKLPAEFEGIGPRKVSSWGSGRVGVFEIGEFYKRFIGFDHIPTSNWEWRAIPESELAACNNGKVFIDPLGEFTAFREGLKKYYPEDVRLKKMASRCMTIAQSGQYNFMRCVMREEYLAAQYAETKFCADTISLVFLLNKEYKPFYKWMHRAMERLPILGEVIYNLLLEIVTTHEDELTESLYEKKSRLMEETCAIIIDELRREGLSDSSSDFLLDHGPIIQSKIQDPELRNLDVWLE